MMETTKTLDGSNLTFALKGRLDTTAAPKVMSEIEEAIAEGVENFVLDMAECDYVASSGLRVVLGAQKKMNAIGGSMVVKNVCESVMEVFNMTGFADILTIE